MSIDQMRLDLASLEAELTDLRAACAALRARAERAEGERDAYKAGLEVIWTLDYHEWVAAMRARGDDLNDHDWIRLIAQTALDRGRALRAPGGEVLE